MPDENEIRSTEDESEEDSGVLLTIAFNAATNHSTLFGIDAVSMTTIFAVDFPFAVPLHFHGIFCEARRDDVPAAERFCTWT
jgi:carotenoid cleavage dioxygenase-like enzyme